MENTKFLIKKFTFILIATIIFSFGCSKSKLDEKPLSFIGPDDFFNTPTQVEAAFAASMNFLWDRWYAYAYGIQDYKNDDQLFDGDLNIPSNWGADKWNEHYTAIMNINAPIKALKTNKLVGVSQAEIDILMGQAKFLRAFNYFMLVRMFGGVPLITEDTPDPTSTEIIRSSIVDVYQLIISDFTEAIVKLPAIWPEEKRGRPTSDAAKGLLAKVYLTMATYPLHDASYYQKAADLAKQVIDGGRYSLVPDINNVFSFATKYGPEMMWSFNTNEQDRTTSVQVWSSMEGWGDLAVDPLWVQGYPDQPRKDAYVETVSRVTGESYITLGVNPGEKKFQYDAQAQWDGVTSFINMPIIRFADVLLIFAEADNMAHGSPTQAAVDAINKVIDRANGYAINSQHPLTSISMSVEAFDTAVIQERNWELCFELGDRWFDLIRKHMVKQVNRVSVQQNFTEDDYLFPIPEKEIRLNPLITQNPGYN